MEYNTAVWTIIISIILFFILREVFCWYYKINDIKNIMEEQRDLLKKIVEKENKNTGEKECSNTKD